MIRWVPSLTAAAIACAVQPFVTGDPVLHVLVQMPACALVGALLPIRRAAIPLRWPLHWAGPLLVLALTTLLIWMLPRSVDAALLSWSGHFAKFISLPLLLGLPLRLVWPVLGPVLRGFLKAQALSMLLLLGFVYTHAPLRLCNSYLVDDQQRLGLGFALAAAGLAVIWITQAFARPASSALKGLNHDLPSLGQ